MCGTRKVSSNGKLGSYQFITYREFSDKVRDFSSGLKELNMQRVRKKKFTKKNNKTKKKKKNDRLGFYSVNREEALVTEVSGWSQSLTTVFLYDTLGPDSLEYIINHSEISVLVASEDKINKILAVSSKCPTLKYIIILPTTKKTDFQSSTVKLLNYREVMEMVKKKKKNIIKKKKQNLFKKKKKKKNREEKHTITQIDQNPTIWQQSSIPQEQQANFFIQNFFLILIFFFFVNFFILLGVPKGVMVEHSNLIAAIASVSVTLPLYPDDVYFSYLPMAHIYEKLCQGSGLLAGNFPF